MRHSAMTLSGACSASTIHARYSTFYDRIIKYNWSPTNTVYINASALFTRADHQQVTDVYKMTATMIQVWDTRYTNSNCHNIRTVTVTTNWQPNGYLPRAVS